MIIKRQKNIYYIFVSTIMCLSFLAIYGIKDTVNNGVENVYNEIKNYNTIFQKYIFSSSKILRSNKYKITECSYNDIKIKYYYNKHESYNNKCNYYNEKESNITQKCDFSNIETQIEKNIHLNKRFLFYVENNSIYSFYDFIPIKDGYFVIYNENEHMDFMFTKYYIYTTAITIIMSLLILLSTILSKYSIKLTYYSYHDPLTKILNRRALFQRSEGFINEAINKDKKVFASLIDIDFFKKINDEYGHDIGDKVLVIISDLIKKELKSNDIFARYGGEEFVILFSEESKDKAEKKLNDIRVVVEETIIKNSIKNLNITISIGFSTLVPNVDRTLDALLKIADKGLYESKENGRNKVTFSNLR